MNEQINSDIVKTLNMVTRDIPSKRFEKLWFKMFAVFFNWNSYTYLTRSLTQMTMGIYKYDWLSFPKYMIF